jgi:hypothetical protein
MAYVIVNDREDPVRYYTGRGFSETDTTAQATAALVYPTLTAVTAVMHRRADLYAAGWRVVPAERQ